jgi:predicted dehydrogenase
MSDTRRAFLKTAVLASAASNRRVFGANDRIRVGGIGVGGRCRYLLSLLEKTGGAEIVAVSDAYKPRMAQARQSLAPNATEHAEYRDLLGRKDIDAVFIGSPDHWHVPMAIDAVRAGKDVYVEKPVSHTIEEGARLIKAVEETGRILQVGYQQRSWDIFQHAAEIIKAGRLGRITMVLSSWYQDYLKNFGRPIEVDAAQVDWKRFLGNAPAQPFEPQRFQNWRWFWDFGGGHLTDLHSHWGDVIHWYMQSERPDSAQAVGNRYALLHFDCPDTINAAWEYPGFTIVYNGTLVGHLEGGTLVFRGSEAELRITRDGFALYPEHVLAPEKTYFPEPLVAEKSKGDGTPDHVRNFLDCVRSRKTPNAPVRSSVAAANSAHLGNLALRKGQRLNSGGILA